jgi:hypothetical protein
MFITLSWGAAGRVPVQATCFRSPAPVGVRHCPRQAQEKIGVSLLRLPDTEGQARACVPSRNHALRKDHEDARLPFRGEGPGEGGLIGSWLDTGNELVNRKPTLLPYLSYSDPYGASRERATKDAMG